MNKYLIIAVILIVIYLWKRRKFYKFAFSLPGPIGYPLIGVGLKLSNSENVMKYILKCKTKYGSPFVSWLGLNCALIVSDPDSVKTILTSENCINKSSVYKLLEYAMGKGSFTSNVPLWYERHKILKPAFHKKILSSYLNIFNKECDTLSKNLNSLIDSDDLKVFDLFKKYTLEVACQTTIGLDINLQNNEFNELFVAYSKSAEAIAERIYKPWFYLDAIYELTNTFKKASKYFGIVSKFMDDIINLKKSQKDSKNKQITNISLSFDENDFEFVKSKDIFIDHIAKFVESGQLSWEDLKDETTVIIAAAFETTSITLYLTFLCIATHPKYQEKLYQELLEMFPEPVFEVNDKDLSEMSYLEMIINESMRCFAPVPLVGRVAMNDFELQNNIIVPKGTEIFIDIFNLHRDTKYWGSNAHKFNPDNFLPDKVKNRPVYAFMPFTKGLRMCLGYKYAMNLLKVVLAKLFRNYKVTTETRFEDLVLTANVSLKLKKYPTFKIERR